MVLTSQLYGAKSKTLRINKYDYVINHLFGLFKFTLRRFYCLKKMPIIAHKDTLICIRRIFTY